MKNRLEELRRECGLNQDELARALRAEVVAVIGRKVILYRRSSRKDFKHIEF